MKRSLTPKVQLVPPCPTDAIDASFSLTDGAAATVKPIASEGRRVRPSTLLSLAAISMGATAGVLFPQTNSKANAAEAVLPQFPLPAEAANNPYQAVPSAEPTQAVATLDESQTLTAERLEQTNAGVPEAVSAPLTESSNANSSFPAVVELKQGALSRSANDSPAETAAVNKKHSKVIYAQLNESVKNDQDLEASSAASTAIFPQSAIATLPASSEPSGVASESALSPAAPVELAKTPQFGETAANEAISIPVPPPETTAKATEQPVAIPIPLPESSVARAGTQTLNPESQPSSAKATQPELIAPQAPAASGERDELSYKVQPGDTIDSIALRYGVSRSELVRLNGLDNPHDIQVARELKIPQPQSLRGNRDRYETVIPGLNVVPQPTEGDRAPIRANQSAPAIVADNRPSTVVPTETSIAPSPKAAESVPVSAAPTSEVPSSSPSENNTAVSASPNPYIERLKADIVRMREEYRNANAARPSAPEANPSAPVVVADAAPVPAVNPEWQGRQERTNATDSGASALQVYSVRVQDNRNEAAKSAQAADTNPREQQPSAQIAIAPVPPVEYNPNTRPQTGIQVAPELPPLSPDRYLPDRPAQFNGYIWPTAGVLTSGYGRRWGRMHRGIDVAGPTGTPIVAAASGEVVSAGWNSGGYGNLVDIRHADGSMTRYAHNSKILVRKGQWVEQGERISLMGSTGNSTGPHLHFEVHPGGNGAVNPIAYLPPR